MKCKEVMKTSVVANAHSEPVRNAAAKMRETGVGFLPVTGPDQRPVGVITDRDIVVRVLAEDRSLSTPVEEAMSTGLITVSCEADLGVAEEMMQRYQKARMVCVDEKGFVAGIISLSDIPAHESARRAGTVFGKIAQRESTPGNGTFSS